MYLILLMGISGCGSSDDITPFIPPIVPTFPIKVGTVSYDFPVESKNWKYGVSDNITGSFQNNFARASYIAERLGSPTGYLCF